MPEAQEKAHLSRDGSPIQPGPGAARKSYGTATKLDSLVVLTALLAYAFGWAPIPDFAESGAVAVVGVGLLGLMIERRFPLKGFWGSSAGWLPTLAKEDALILLIALGSSALLFLPLIVAVVGWILVEWWARRGQRAGADEWFHRSSLLTSFVAMMVAAQAAKIWLYSGPRGDGAPSPLDHAGFHEFLNGAIGVSCALLLLVLAWTTLRKGQRETVVTLVVGGLPAAILSG